jgi:hypothetical protein
MKPTDRQRRILGLREISASDDAELHRYGSGKDHRLFSP